MRKDSEDTESPKRNIRDSGYIDCWDSERSDSLSPPRHGREDSFDSLDSFGSRSRQTPSPDVLVTRGSSDGRGSDSESDAPHRKMPDVRKDDMLARRTSVSEPRVALPFNQYLPNKSNQSSYVPPPLRKKRSDREEGGRKSWSTATSPIGGDRPFRFGQRASVSDEPESVSMIDMRCEEDAILQPHSQVRHELMHNQYNKMKEEEDHWQDDLARWKNRRRSVSQDLIKKEEERKMMEKLMSGDGSTSQRRKSIKTYREIVEEKERREEELRDAYRRARTQEEAQALLQRYAQRFSISEAVLERLQLPRLLDRSVSSDSAFPTSPLSLTASPTTPEVFDMDPDGPLRYLRQQSAPVPKFTSTVEARVEEFPKDSPPHRPQIRSRSSEPLASRALSPKPVTLLTAKPYIQPKISSQPGKAEGLVRVNGEMGDVEGPNSPENGGGASPLVFQPAPDDAADTPATSAPNAEERSSGEALASPLPTETQAGPVPGPEEAQINSAEQCTPPCRPTSLPTVLQKQQESPEEQGGWCAAAQKQKEEADTGAALQQTPPTEPKPTHKEQPEVCVSTTAPKQTSAISSLTQSERPTQQSQPMTSQVSGNTQESSQKTESGQLFSVSESFGYKPVCKTPTERMEKEQRSNDKYQREQAKLKEEWERAQREVVEEERKYHEEERRILEETVAPLTPRSSALPSPIRGELSCTMDPNDTIVRSLADWERKQELLERQSKGSTESVEWRRKENDRSSDISSITDESMKTGKSSFSQHSSQAESLPRSRQNGQRAPPMVQSQSKSFVPAKKHAEHSLDGSKPSRPAGDRRCGSVDNNTGRSPSKPPSSCPPSDTQPPSPSRSVSGKKLCSSCGQPLGKGAAMIIETLSLYFHIQCFKCGVCKGQLGDTTTGTDVRIRNGLLNCHQCYIRSRSAGQPTTL